MIVITYGFNLLATYTVVILLITIVNTNTDTFEWDTANKNR